MSGTVVLDFDGVLHSYTSGWKGAHVIPDPPVVGAQDFVRELHASGYGVEVASTRATTAPGRRAMQAWFVANGFPAMAIAHGKPPGIVYLDDRALRFEGPGKWPTMAEIKEASVPWQKR